MTRAKLEFLKRLIIADTDFSRIQRSLKINGITWIFDHRKEQVHTKSDLRQKATVL